MSSLLFYFSKSALTYCIAPICTYYIVYRYVSICFAPGFAKCDVGSVQSPAKANAVSEPGRALVESRGNVRLCCVFRQVVFAKDSVEKAFFRLLAIIVHTQTELYVIFCYRTSRLQWTLNAAQLNDVEKYILFKKADDRVCLFHKISLTIPSSFFGRYV